MKQKHLLEVHMNRSAKVDVLKIDTSKANIKPNIVF